MAPLRSASRGHSETSPLVHVDDFVEWRATYRPEVLYVVGVAPRRFRYEGPFGEKPQFDVYVGIAWSGWPDLNRRPRRPERRALPTALHPD